MFGDVRRVYVESLKPRDSLFNLYLARPLAAPLVLGCARLGISPNAVTFLSLVPMVAGLAAWILIPGSQGLWWGLVGIELAYILDCVDGQLARLTGKTSPVGAELDFLMDEIKAVLLVAAAVIRIHSDGASVHSLYLGLAGLAVVSIAISLTKFIRGPEYAAATGLARRGHGTASENPGRGLVGLAEMPLKTIAHYPASLPIFLLVADLELFLWTYCVVHLLYVGKTSLGIMVRLLKPARENDEAGGASS